MDAADGPSTSTRPQESKPDAANNNQNYNTTSSRMMNETQSIGCFSQVSRPSTVSSESRVFSFSSCNTFPGLNSQTTTASLTTTTLPVWAHVPPRTQTLGGSSNQEFGSTNPGMFPPKSTFTAPNSAPCFEFSAHKTPVPSGQRVVNRSRLILHPLRRQPLHLTTSAKNTYQISLCLPSTTTSSTLFSAPGPSTTAAPKDWFKFPTSTESNVFSNVKISTLPDNKNFKFNSYQQLPVEGKNNTFNWSLPTSFQNTNETTFGLRGSLFNAFRNYPEENSNSSENKRLAHKEVQTSTDAADAMDVKGLFKEIWRILECIICLDIVKSPIFQCESGHHFCNQCWCKVTVCPVCKRKKTNVRNFALESVLDKLPVLCKYHNEGCDVMLLLKDKEKHESTCRFQPFICPIAHCVQKVDQRSLMSHCVTGHDIRISAVECTLDNRSYVWNSHNVDLRKYICVFNLLQWGLFLLCHKEVEHTSCIWLQLLHDNSKDSTFMYEVQLSDSQNFQCVKYKGPVTRLSYSSEEVKHKCLRISSELIFAMRSTALEMKLEIWKKNMPT